MNLDFEIKLGEKLSKVQILREDGNLLKVAVNGKKYDIDIVNVEDGIYSILYKNKSYNIEIIESENSKKYTVNTPYQTYDAEVVDAETRYIASRNQSKELEGNNIISSPMPGRIVRIPVTEGQEVAIGQTVVVVSAMKMESEYKSPKNGIVKNIHVKAGDVVIGHQPLVTIE
jgi:biotin carboxyl carrier protein